jgi:hypothetical protein
MKNITKLAVITCSVFGLAAAAYAANHTNTGEGQDGSTFWTLFKYNSNNNCPNAQNKCGVNVTDNRYRTATIKFSNPDRPDTDFVGGVGWQNVAKPSNISYKVSSWSWPTTVAFDSRGVFGVYGWSCPINAGVSDKNVEFYIIDNWVGSNQYIPYDGSLPMTAKETFTANGASYNIYQSSLLDRANACGTGQKFFQVWAVRQGKRSLTNASGGIANNVDFTTIGGKMANYGYFHYPLRYLVVGVDVFQAVQGNVSLNYVDKS